MGGKHFDLSKTLANFALPPEDKPKSEAHKILTEVTTKTDYTYCSFFHQNYRDSHCHGHISMTSIYRGHCHTGTALGCMWCNLEQQSTVQQRRYKCVRWMEEKTLLVCSI